MAPIGRRDGDIATAVGGAIPGAASAGFGTFLLLAALTGFPTDPLLEASVVVTFFATGSAFLLVSLIVRPAWRAPKLDMGSRAETAPEVPAFGGHDENPAQIPPDGTDRKPGLVEGCRSILDFGDE
jgi:hypothetical protein